VPGDPERVKRIAELMDKPTFLASHREYTSYLAYLDGKPVVICSTGIGGPSTSIAVEELAQLGVNTFLRVGTTGAIQPHVNVGDVIVTQASVRLDGASLHFAPPPWLPPVVTPELNHILGLQPHPTPSTRGRNAMIPLVAG
jgi:uridine phosphorylase